VEGVHIDDERLTVELTDGRSITVPLAWYPRLFFVTAKQRQNWKLAGGGYGIHWPDIDEDLSTRESCVVRPRRAEAPPRLNLGPEQNKRPGPGWIDCSPYCFGLRQLAGCAMFRVSTGTRKKQAGEAGGFCTAAPMRRRANPA